YGQKAEYAFMIKPGLLTASTSKADHFGMSGFCVSVCVCFSIFFDSFSVFWFLVLKRECFPLAVTLGCDWRRRAHPEGRNNEEESQTCALWLSWTMGTRGGN